MKIGVLCKEGDEKSLQCLTEFKRECDLPCVSLDEADSLSYIVCFGGDGTTLKAIDYSLKFNAPIISVNTGNVGFLSAYSPNQLKTLLQDIKTNAVNLQEKSLLSIQCEGENHFALNDVIIERDHTLCSETNELTLKIDSETVQKAVCDGIIVATPTGSTAYSLSAGGAILHPSVKALIATFICCHSMNSRPIVFNDNQSVEIKIEKATSPATVFCDGKVAFKLSKEIPLTIKKCEKSVKIACRDNFFGILSDKLQNWSNRR